MPAITGMEYIRRSRGRNSIDAGGGHCRSLAVVLCRCVTPTKQDACALRRKRGSLAGAAWCRFSMPARIGVQIKCLVVHLCRNDHSSVAAATMLRRRKEKRKEGCRRVGVPAACSTPHEPESKWRKERVPLVLSLFSVAAEASSCYTTARSSACLVRVARG